MNEAMNQAMILPITQSMMAALFALFPVALLALTFLLPLLWSRENMLLGVRVTSEFIAGSQARAVRREYAIRVIAITLCALALTVTGLATGRLWLWLVAEALELMALLLTWSAAWRRLQTHRAARSAVRAASLSPQPSRAELAWLLTTLAANLPLAGAAAILAFHWQSIPGRFPTHWGVNGHVNGWSARTPAGVFGNLILGAVVILFLAFLGALTARSSAGFAGRPAILRLTRNTLRATAWVLSLVFSTAGLLPLMSNPARSAPWQAIASMIFAVGIIVWFAIRATSMPAAMAAAQDSTPHDCWKAGLIYYNPADSALMVPKRTGLGYTLNFARPAAWAVMAGVIFVAFVLPLLLRHSRVK
jgi:uncharacterized membrane protein